MQTNFIERNLQSVQNYFYPSENFSKEHPILSRVGLIPAAIIDHGAENIKRLIGVVQHVVMAVFNLLGVFFNPHEYSLEDAGRSLGNALISAVLLVALPLTSLVKFCLNMYDVEEASSVGRIFLANPVYRRVDILAQS
ncbi:MAG: hypothetical protein KGJ02_01215 [Verrucomicrobiota bacterium]|nr:hypothetical protein [Verrucomicrobiota bacterium]